MLQQPEQCKYLRECFHFLQCIPRSRCYLMVVLLSFKYFEEFYMLFFYGGCTIYISTSIAVDCFSPYLHLHFLSLDFFMMAILLGVVGNLCYWFCFAFPPEGSSGYWEALNSVSEPASSLFFKGPVF